MGIALVEGEAVTEQLINKVHLKMVGDWWSVRRCSWCHDLEGWVGYLGRVGWIRGKLMGRGVMFVKDKFSRFQYCSRGGKSICKKDKTH